MPRTSCAGRSSVRHRGGKLFVEGASVVVMALYLARQRACSRRYPVLVSPKHRPVAARILDDLGATLAGLVVGQLLAMMVLAFPDRARTVDPRRALLAGLRIFTGLVAVVPFFGTLVSTLLPRCSSSARATGCGCSR